MQMEHPYYLLALGLLPVFAFIYFQFLQWRKKAILRMGDRKVVQKIIPRRAPLLHLRFILLMLALTGIIFSLANPQIAASGKTVKHAGIDVALVMDCSRSMLAPDVQPNRFSAAKQIALNFIQAMPEEKFALVSFAAEPSVVLPLTPDHAAAEMLVHSITVDVSQGQGSDIGAAIQEAIRALPNNQNHYRAIVLLSDGEDFGNEMNDAIQQASHEQIAICTIGIGTLRGSTIPDSASKSAPPVKRDENGEEVITRLHPEILNKLAGETSGASAIYNGSNQAFNAVLQRLNGINKNLYDDKLVKQYDSAFQFFLLPSLILLIMEFFVGSYRFRFLNKKI
jgi:Ca-activated chloride channel homolog